MSWECRLRATTQTRKAPPEKLEDPDALPINEGGRVWGGSAARPAQCVYTEAAGRRGPRVAATRGDTRDVTGTLGCRVDWAISSAATAAACTGQSDAPQAADDAATDPLTIGDAFVHGSRDRHRAVFALRKRLDGRRCGTRACACVLAGPSTPEPPLVSIVLATYPPRHRLHEALCDDRVETLPQHRPRPGRGPAAGASWIFRGQSRPTRVPDGVGYVLRGATPAFHRRNGPLTVRLPQVRHGPCPDLHTMGTRRPRHRRAPIAVLCLAPRRPRRVPPRRERLLDARRREAQPAPEPGARRDRRHLRRR